MIAVGLVGCGAVVHSSYAATLRGRDDYSVQYVCDTDESQVQSAAAVFDARVSTIDEIARNADAVIISTPPSTHGALIEKCLRADRVVLCEKPFTTTLDEAERLGKAAEASGTLLRVGHFRRTFPQLELARDIVAQGLIGDVESFSVAEGGRFTWRSVSDYPVRDPSGGVLWDTGSHTIDMALFASGLDLAPGLAVGDVSVQKDRAEPSHEFAARFTVFGGTSDVRGSVRFSRRDALPNSVTVTGSLGRVSFSTDLDDRLRLTTPRGSTVVRAPQSYTDLMECFDLQLKRVLLRQRDDDFAASRFFGQVHVLEVLANA